MIRTSTAEPAETADLRKEAEKRLLREVDEIVEMQKQEGCWNTLKLKKSRISDTLRAILILKFIGADPLRPGGYDTAVEDGLDLIEDAAARSTAKLAHSEEFLAILFLSDRQTFGKRLIDHISSDEGSSFPRKAIKVLSLAYPFIGDDTYRQKVEDILSKELEDVQKELDSWVDALLDLDEVFYLEQVLGEDTTGDLYSHYRDFLQDYFDVDYYPQLVEEMDLSFSPLDMTDSKVEGLQKIGDVHFGEEKMEEEKFREISFSLVERPEDVDLIDLLLLNTQDIDDHVSTERTKRYMLAQIDDAFESSFQKNIDGGYGMYRMHSVSTLRAVTVLGQIDASLGGVEKIRYSLEQAKDWLIKKYTLLFPWPEYKDNLVYFMKGIFWLYHALDQDERLEYIVEQNARSLRLKKEPDEVGVKTLIGQLARANILYDLTNKGIYKDKIETVLPEVTRTVDPHDMDEREDLLSVLCFTPPEMRDEDVDEMIDELITEVSSDIQPKDEGREEYVRSMEEVQLSLSEDVIKQGREYARKRLERLLGRERLSVNSIQELCRAVDLLNRDRE